MTSSAVINEINRRISNTCSQHVGQHTESLEKQYTKSSKPKNWSPAPSGMSQQQWNEFQAYQKSKRHEQNKSKNGSKFNGSLGYSTSSLNTSGFSDQQTINSMKGQIRHLNETVNTLVGILNGSVSTDGLNLSKV